MKVAPPIEIFVEACAVKVPGVVLLIVRVQVATLPTTDGVAQVSLWVPSAGVTPGVMELNTTGEAPFGIAVAVIVKMCWLPTSFTLLSGVMVMFASGFAFVNVQVTDALAVAASVMLTLVPVVTNVLTPVFFTQT